MVYFTGDIHGSGHELMKLCEQYESAAADTVVLLGDVGANYFLDERDRKLKAELSRLQPTILCIHGNHEIRPANIPSYITKEWNGSTVWYEEEFPNILFAKDGDIYSLEDISYLAIGGAYSVNRTHSLRYTDTVKSELIAQSKKGIFILLQARILFTA